MYFAHYLGSFFYQRISFFHLRYSIMSLCRLQLDSPRLQKFFVEWFSEHFPLFNLSRVSPRVLLPTLFVAKYYRISQQEDNDNPSLPLFQGTWHHIRAGESASSWHRRWEPSKGPVSRSRAVYAKLESNSEPERARVCQRVAVRASESQSGSHREP